MSMGENTTQVTKLSTAVLPKKDQFEFWYSAMNQRGTRISIEPNDASAFTGIVKTTLVGDILISHMYCDANEVIRTPSHINQDTELYYIVHLPLANQLTLTANGEVTEVAAGSLVILNTEFPIIASQAARNLISLKIPVTSLPELTLEQAILGFSFNQIPFYVKRLLISIAHQAFAKPMTMVEQVECRESILGSLTALVTNKDTQIPYMKQFLFGEVCRFVDANYASSISLEQVAHKLQISKIYIHKILASKGMTFRELLTQRRMQGAIGKMLDKNKHFTRFSDIALDVGYKNPSHFTKAFNKQFNMAPFQFYKSFNLFA